MKHFLLLPSLLLLISACRIDEAQYDEATLTEFRRAIPTASLIEPSVPEASVAAVLGEAASVPQWVGPAGSGINTLVGQIIDTLDTVTALPPTSYDATTKEFFWGPYPNDDSDLAGDSMGLYIRDQGEDEDLRYFYAFARSADNTIENMVPIIWGAATPDAENEEYGVGVSVLDFEANEAFEEEHNPGHEQLTQGRLALLYLKGDGGNDFDGDVTLVLAVVRDFLDENAEVDAEAANFEYLWGGLEPSSSSDRLDFWDLNIAANLSDESEAIETLGIHTAFYNSGIGQADLDIVGGDVTEGRHLVASECWDGALARTYWNLDDVDIDDETDVIDVESEGDVADCALGDLSSVPSLDTVAADDPEILDALITIAETGSP